MPVCQFQHQRVCVGPIRGIIAVARGLSTQSVSACPPGHRAALQPLLDKNGAERDEVRVVDAPEVVEMSDSPAETSRKKALNSMAVGMDLVKHGEADAFVTVGNTGGAMRSEERCVGKGGRSRW